MIQIFISGLSFFQLVAQRRGVIRVWICYASMTYAIGLSGPPVPANAPTKTTEPTSRSTWRRVLCTATERMQRGTELRSPIAPSKLAPVLPRTS